jgi:hypothetical protein
VVLNDEQKAELQFLSVPSKQWTRDQHKILQNYYKKNNKYRDLIKELRENLGGYGEGKE